MGLSPWQKYIFTSWLKYRLCVCVCVPECFCVCLCVYIYPCVCRYDGMGIPKSGTGTFIFIFCICIAFKRKAYHILTKSVGSQGSFLGKITKSSFSKSDLDEIFRECFFYKYYDPVRISSRLPTSLQGLFARYAIEQGEGRDWSIA